MSRLLIDRNPVLKRLRDEGYNIEIRHGFLLVTDIPHVNSSRQIKRGILVVKLELAGDDVVKPKTHVAYFKGEYPCRSDGSAIEQIRNQTAPVTLAEGLTVDHTFSAKPKPNDAYDDYYHQVTTYVSILAGPAKQIDPGVKAQTAKPVAVENDVDDVFKYIDTNASRAGIDVIANKMRLDKVAIIGTGGTGSYVLDLVAKTRVKEIHLFDRDTFLSHNAFRAPGAASLDELRSQPSKVEYLQGIYSKMRHGIFAHRFEIDGKNIELLREMKFVFICIDHAPSKKIIVERLEEWGIPFVDVGMGIYRADDSLGGTVRATASTPDDREIARSKISFFDAEANNDYATNIQIAELNMLNAAMAVLMWKKQFGFYLNYGKELHCTYTVELNLLTNNEAPNEAAIAQA